MIQEWQKTQLQLGVLDARKPKWNSHAFLMTVFSPAAGEKLFQELF